LGKSDLLNAAFARLRGPSAGDDRPKAIECDAIVDALLDTEGNKAEAARQLGMSRATIYRKIRGYGLTVPLESA